MTSGWPCMSSNSYILQNAQSSLPFLYSQGIWISINLSSSRDLIWYSGDISQTSDISVTLTYWINITNSVAVMVVSDSPSRTDAIFLAAIIIDSFSIRSHFNFLLFRFSDTIIYYYFTSRESISVKVRRMKKIRKKNCSCPFSWNKLFISQISTSTV